MVYSLSTPRPDVGPNEITFLPESGHSGRDVKLATRLHLVSRIGMCNDIYIYRYREEIYIYIYTVIPRLTSDPGNEFFG